MSRLKSPEKPMPGIKIGKSETPESKSEMNPKDRLMYEKRLELLTIMMTWPTSRKDLDAETALGVYQDYKSKYDFLAQHDGLGHRPDDFTEYMDFLYKKAHSIPIEPKEVKKLTKPETKPEFRWGLRGLLRKVKVLGSSIQEHFQTGSLAGTASVSVLIGAGIRATAKSIGAEELGVGLSAGIGATYGALREGFAEYKKIEVEKAKKVVEMLEQKKTSGDAEILKIVGNTEKEKVRENLWRIAKGTLKGAVAGMVGAVVGDYATRYAMDQFGTKPDLTSQTVSDEMAKSVLELTKNTTEMHGTVWETAKEMLEQYSKQSGVDVNLSNYNINELKNWLLTQNRITEEGAKFLQEGHSLNIEGAQRYLDSMFNPLKLLPKLSSPDTTTLNQVPQYGQDVLKGTLALVGVGSTGLGEIARKGWGWFNKKPKSSLITLGI